MKQRWTFPAAAKGARALLSPQIRDVIRRSVVSGQLRPGTRLPSSRGLAAELGVSRNTVTEAYDQLLSEGVVRGRHGAGTFVTTSLPFEHRPPSPAVVDVAALSNRGRTFNAITSSHSAGKLGPFSPGIPALDASLLTTWFQAAASAARNSKAELLTYGDPAGYEPLRETVASYLGPTRGIRCTADQILITTGTQQAISIAAKLLLDEGQTSWVEDPGYPGAIAALLSAGAELARVPIDRDGLNVAAGQRLAPAARLAYVSPSHQYPLGVTMTVERRMELLAWAKRAGAWILEDDYDSEFRHHGRTVPALQGLDDSGCVLYFGTFSKSLFPSVRVGYLVVPSRIAPAFAKAMAIEGNGPPLIEQAALHQFIEGGGYRRHLKQVRALYRDRHAAFLEAMHKQLGRTLRFSDGSMGLHITGELSSRRDDRRLSTRAAATGLSLPPLSAYYGRQPASRGFVMGYAHVPVPEIRAAVTVMARVLRS